jgi:hypothetical protein
MEGLNVSSEGHQAPIFSDQDRAWLKKLSIFLFSVLIASPPLIGHFYREGKLQAYGVSAAQFPMDIGELALLSATAILHLASNLVDKYPALLAYLAAVGLALCVVITLPRLIRNRVSVQSKDQSNASQRRMDRWWQALVIFVAPVYIWFALTLIVLVVFLPLVWFSQLAAEAGLKHIEKSATELRKESREEMLALQQKASTRLGRVLECNQSYCAAVFLTRSGHQVEAVKQAQVIRNFGDVLAVTMDTDTAKSL